MIGRTRFAWLLGRRRVSPGEEASREALRRTLGGCPVCGKRLDESHRYWVLAEAPAVSQEWLTIEANVSKRDWQFANKYSWNHAQDSLQVTVVRCPSSDDFSILTSFHGATLDSPSYLVASDVISFGEGQDLLRLAGESWRSFSTTSSRDG